MAEIWQLPFLDSDLLLKRGVLFLFTTISGDMDVPDIYLTSLGFLDDIYFVCSSLLQAQATLNDVIHLASLAGLHLNSTKLH